MSDEEMRVWAELHVEGGSPLAAGVLRLLKEKEQAVQTRGLLSEFAKSDFKERVEDVMYGVIAHGVNLEVVPVFDGATGPPEDGKAGRKSTGSGA